MRVLVLTLSLSVLLLPMGCAEDTVASNACAQAEAHVASCTGTSGLVGASCDAAQAETLLDTPCEGMNPAGLAKGDFWSTGNPLCIVLVTARDLPDETICCFDANCTSGSVCQDYRCREAAGVGEECGRNSHCVTGLICSTEGSCKEPGVQGSPCTSDGQCEDAFLCVTETCEEPLKQGEACEVGGNDCASELFCAAGQCRALDEADGACESDMHCALGLSCEGGVCSEPGEVGASCDVGQTDCAMPLSCIAGTCAESPALGEVCEPDPFWMCGTGNTCWEGVCAPVHTRGEPCNTRLDCEGGSCESGSCQAK